MLKISTIARHTIVQMGACAKAPKSPSCPDIMAKMF